MAWLSRGYAQRGQRPRRERRNVAANALAATAHRRAVAQINVLRTKPKGTGWSGKTMGKALPSVRLTHANTSRGGISTPHSYCPCVGADHVLRLFQGHPAAITVTDVSSTRSSSTWPGSQMALDSNGSHSGTSLRGKGMRLPDAVTTVWPHICVRKQKMSRSPCMTRTGECLSHTVPCASTMQHATATFKSVPSSR